MIAVVVANREHYLIMGPCGGDKLHRGSGLTISSPRSLFTVRTGGMARLASEPCPKKFDTRESECHQLTTERSARSRKWDIFWENSWCSTKIVWGIERFLIKFSYYLRSQFRSTGEDHLAFSHKEGRRRCPRNSLFFFDLFECFAELLNFFCSPWS